jgi:hypothetical protein
LEEKNVSEKFKEELSSAGKLGKKETHFHNSDDLRNDTIVEWPRDVQNHQPVDQAENGSSKYLKKNQKNYFFAKKI